MYNTYSVIWGGDEEVVTEQIKFMTKWARENGIQSKSWKDKTIQARVCQYTGNPNKNKDHGRYAAFQNKLDKKYSIIETTKEKIVEFHKMFGKKFSYTTETELYVAVIDLFEVLTDADVINEYSFEKAEHKFNSEEELNEFIANYPLMKNQKFISKQHKYKHYPRIYVAGKPPVEAERTFSTSYTIETTLETKFRPWVVLTDDSIAAVAEKMTENHGGGDKLTEFQAKEREIINAYNAANNACGRISMIRNADQETWANKEQLKHYLLREQADHDLKVVRKELGNVKRQMTKMAKKGGDNGVGIEFDLKPYSYVI